MTNTNVVTSIYKIEKAELAAFNFFFYTTVNMMPQFCYQRHTISRTKTKTLSDWRHFRLHQKSTEVWYQAPQTDKSLQLFIFRRCCSAELTKQWQRCGMWWHELPWQQWHGDDRGGYGGNQKKQKEKWQGSHRGASYMKREDTTWEREKNYNQSSPPHPSFF